MWPCLIFALQVVLDAWTCWGSRSVAPLDRERLMETEAPVCSSLLAHHLRQVGDDAGGEEHRAVLPVWLLHRLLGHLLHQRSPQTKLQGVAG